jgi:hypothetical protein
VSSVGATNFVAVNVLLTMSKNINIVDISS